ncbi:hypothetical protein FHS89_001275 [Rubricella aquisinus]|uniref:Uncharacterized protein n=1 Tax=Rubricella aquisinus TaxID=2028108 RepID=A0A840X037_9RHOB|nr:hypothetical protein [Rubricella aquisinus]MBB5515265.1 hypothetical protein [Rubricella aquisinus]
MSDKGKSGMSFILGGLVVAVIALGAYVYTDGFGANEPEISVDLVEG